jgi:hypothetical protein
MEEHTMNCNSHHARRITRAWALPLVSALLPMAAAAIEPEDNKCNENQGIRSDTLPEAEGSVHAQQTGTPLLPGYRCKTQGTNKDESPELDGVPVVKDDSGTFSFTEPDPLGLNPEDITVSGTYQQLIVKSDSDATLKQHTRFKLTSGCIARIRIHQYDHPLPIVADYRDDLKGMVRSDFASRSLDGLSFEFHLKRPVCAGETSRWLLLNTSILQVKKVNALELITPSGNSSPQLLPIRVPASAP